MAGKADTRTANVVKYFDSQLADSALREALAKQVCLSTSVCWAVRACKPTCRLQVREFYYEERARLLYCQTKLLGLSEQERYKSLCIDMLAIEVHDELAGCDLCPNTFET